MESYENDDEIPESYEDSVVYAWDVLLPQVRSGKEFQFYGNFIPSYVFEVVSVISAAPDEYDGFVRIVIQLPAKFVNRIDAIARLVEILHKNADDQIQAQNFVEDCLELIEKKKLQLDVAFYQQEVPKSTFSNGLLLNRETPDVFWVYEDSKPGDNNKRIRIFRSWFDHEYIEAREILERLIELADQRKRRLRLFSGGETISWLTKASSWSAQLDGLELDQSEVLSEPFVDGLGLDLDEEEDDFEKLKRELLSVDDVPAFDLLGRNAYEARVYNSVLEFLSKLPEFSFEDERLDEDELDDLSDLVDFYTRTQGMVEVDPESYGYHFEPITNELTQMILGFKTARCKCGVVSIRVLGCSEIVW
mgnify:CR=1 FL=1